MIIGVLTQNERFCCEILGRLASEKVDNMQDSRKGPWLICTRKETVNILIELSFADAA